jgi:hypothetical protein
MKTDCIFHDARANTHDKITYKKEPLLCVCDLGIVFLLNREIVQGVWILPSEKVFVHPCFPRNAASVF